MDSASPEEKASANWAIGRAALQYSYQVTLRPQDGPAKNIESGNPLVDFLVKSAQSLANSHTQTGLGSTYIKGFSDLRNLPLFTNGAGSSGLQQAIQQTQQLTRTTSQNSRAFEILA